MREGRHARDRRSTSAGSGDDGRRAKLCLRADGRRGHSVGWTGCTNAATGILVAHDNGWPLLVLGGRRPLHMQHLGSFQQLDAIPIFRPITKCACLIEGAAEIPEMLARAFRIAVSGRPGPVYLDVPEEALQKTAIVGQPALSQPKSQTIESALLDHAADILLIAERPALIIGDGLRWSAPFAELGQLVAQLKTPFVTSPMARGFLPDDHPLCHNAARSTVLSTADAIVIAGARLDWTFQPRTSCLAGTS